MHNLYCLAPDMNSTKSVITELRELGISEENIFVVAKDHQAVQVERLREAELGDVSDLYGSFKRYLMVGAGLGMLAGFILALVMPARLATGEGVALVSLLGASLGAWASVVVRMSAIQPSVEKFEQAIEEGSLLIMADVPHSSEQSVRRSIKQHHPEVLVEGLAIA